ncbi:MAG TPA: hypothetical protein VKG82_00800 [Solirubrobacteraceae bacterium]|nr:hypothetical protein [Solirubrobacteraceae bacterium]
MPQIHTSRRRAASAVLILILMAVMAVALSACGSSSSKSASAASATAPSTTGSPTPKSLASRFAALRECLAKNGVTLPQRPAGQRPGGGFLGGAGGFHLPAGVSRAQYEAALNKCRAGARLSGGTRGFGRLRSPAFRVALRKFAACMRANGVNVSEPNTSGSGPVFGTKGLDTTSPQFKVAISKCSSDLRSTYRHPSTGAVPGTPGAAAGGTLPPAGQAGETG